MWPEKGNRIWPSESSGVTVVSVGSCGGYGQQSGSTLRDGVSRPALAESGTHLLSLTPKPELGNRLLSPMPSASNLLMKSSLF